MAIVGSRKGADLGAVVRLVEALREAQPDTVVVSGGAEGVDQMAESTWFRLGGRVRSYRPAPWGKYFGVEVWNYGPGAPASVLPVSEQRVQFADFRSAALYRNWLIAEDCDRLVAFYRAGGSPGTAHTEAMARGVDVHVFVVRPLLATSECED